MTPDEWNGWNGRGLDEMSARVDALSKLPEVIARMEGKQDAQYSAIMGRFDAQDKAVQDRFDDIAKRRWNPTAKSGLAAALVLAAAPIISLLAASH